MRLTVRLLPLLLWIAEPLAAQLPFYTDDPAVTETWKWHFEFLDYLAAKYIASPRIGGQIGFSVDFPDVFRERASGKVPSIGF
jgi:hypothetical protein